MFVSNNGYWFGGGAVYVGENASLITDNAELIFVGNIGGVSIRYLCRVFWNKGLDNSVEPFLQHS